MTSPTPTIGTRLTKDQRELRRPSLRDDVEQLEELVLFDSSRVDPKGQTYIDPGSTGINIIPNGPILYIISQLKGIDHCNIAQISRRFNTLIEQHRERLYIEEDFDTLMNRGIDDTVYTGSEIWWMARHHPERKCSPQVLNFASENGYTKIVKLLLKANKPCSETALNSASQNGHIEIVKLLLAAGSPYSDCTTRALNRASLRDHIEIVKLLLAADKPYTETGFYWTSVKGYTEIVKLLSTRRDLVCI